MANKNIDNNEFAVVSFGKEKFEILNKNNDGFIVETKFGYGGWTQKSLSIRIQGVCGSKSIDSEYDLLIIEPFLEHFSEFEKEYIEFSAQLDKDDKITDISQKSIETWIKSLFQESAYTYCMAASENKIVLSVKMKNGTQLDIPVYYKKFQQIMPQIMPTILEYENLIEKRNMKDLPLHPSRTGMVFMVEYPSSRTDSRRYGKIARIPRRMGGNHAENRRFAFGGAQQPF